MVAIARAVRVSAECDREFDPHFELRHVHLLSIGTGKLPYFAKPPANGAGILWWAQKLLNLVMNSQAQGIHFQAKYILGNRYYRVDYDLPNGTWSLDSAHVLDQLIHFGKAKAAETISTRQPVFFTHRAVRYQPYPDLSNDPVQSC